MFETLLADLRSLLEQFYGRFIVAVIIMLIGFIIGRLASRILKKILHEMEVDSIIKKAGLKFSLEELISAVAAYFIYFAAAILALNQLGLTATVLNLISAAALILIVVSVLLAIKDFVPNLVAGFSICRKGKLKEGDKVSISDVKGTVSKLALTEIEIKTAKGDIIYVPNSLITKQKLSVRRIQTKN